jgi:hypothetical protein
MFSELAFFSFTGIADESQHRSYNEWHQLDHRPENLALPGVAWGERWASRGEYSAAAQATEHFDNLSYVNMYWFRPPVEQAVAEWTALGEASFQWGRGPLIPGVERQLLAFFHPVKGYAAASALVSPEVLPYRPSRGLHLTLSQISDAHSLEAHADHLREDREVIPDLLELDGVAGAWTFSFAFPQHHDSLDFETTPSYPPGSMRIRLLYLDEDPLAVTTRIAAVDERIGRPPSRETLFRGPLKTIVPWQDW